MDIVHITEIAQGHGQQIAVRLHDPLGLARSARGIEQRSQILRGPIRHGGLDGLRRCGFVGGIAQNVEALRISPCLQRGGVQGRARPYTHGTGILQHMGQLARVQFVVGRYRHRTHPVNRLHQLQVFGAVGRINHHAVARPHVARPLQMRCQRRHAGAQGGVITAHLSPQQHRRARAMGLGAAVQELGDVHGHAPPNVDVATIRSPPSFCGLFATPVLAVPGSA